MHELSFGITSNNAWSGPARNPVNPTLIPGGSSGGTAAAVAAGIAPIGLAADTGGSSRLPAALCGVVGFRPTAGRYPTTGVLPISHTRDTPGVIAHSVADIALVDPILAESSVAATPPRATSLSGVQLGAPAQFWEDLDPQVERVCRRAWEALDSAGAIIIEVDVSPLLALTAQVGLPLCLYEFPRGLRAYLEANEYPITPENVFDAVASPDVRAITAAARDLGTISDEAYAQVLAAREHLVTSYAELLRANRLAALVFPTAPLPAGRSAEQHRRAERPPGANVCDLHPPHRPGRQCRPPWDQSAGGAYRRGIARRPRTRRSSTPRPRAVGPGRRGRVALDQPVVSPTALHGTPRTEHGVPGLLSPSTEPRPSPHHPLRRTAPVLDPRHVRESPEISMPIETAFTRRFGVRHPFAGAGLAFVAETPTWPSP